ncbi:major capsid protein [robinz microvirus RP_42]|nr:major capsid protein [robinz microvirus RP_42]
MNIFNTIPRPKVKTTRFNLSHEIKTSVGFGKITPFLNREVMPGDKWNVSNDFLCRFQPLLAPLMHNVDIRTETYFVPYRLIWKDTSDFFTGGKDGTLEPVKPYVNTTLLATYAASAPNRKSFFQKGSLWDYFGLPLINNATTTFPFPPGTRIDISSFLAYQMIYQEYYRDQNLTDPYFEFPFPSGEIISAPDWDELFQIRNRCYEKDYFTGCLPFTQRAPQVTIPLSGDEVEISLRDYDGQPLIGRVLGVDGSPLVTSSTLDVGLGSSLRHREPGAPSASDSVYDPNGTLVMNASQTGITIEDLRRSSALQRLFEVMARGGARYIEMLLNVFGVASSDSRLQRPEYVGGGKSPLVVSTVLQTSGQFQDGDPVSTTPQGNMSGYGIGGGLNHGCHRYFEEHGFLLSFMTIRPRTSYQMGLERQWTRFDRFEYPFPQLANLGEQPVYTRELFNSATLASNKIFGYVPRYADWKHINSRITGEFRDSLAHWDLTRKFADEPVLSQDFMEIDQEDANRIFAAGSLTRNQQVIVQIRNNINCTRRLPKFGVPKLS